MSEMTEILKLNRNINKFKSETLPEIIEKLEAENKIKKINTERSIGKDLTTYLAVVNEHPDTVYYVDKTTTNRGYDGTFNKFFINYPNGENPTTITDKIVTEKPPKISVWEVVKSSSKGGRKSRKSRKSKKQRKSRRSRR